MRWRYPLFFWIAMVGVAFLNNDVAEKYFVQELGNFNGNVYKVIILGAVIFVLSGLHAVETRGKHWLRAAFGTGILWAVLSCGLGAAIAFYRLGYPLETIPHAYLVWFDTPVGKMWTTIPLIQIVAPIVISKMMNLR